MFMIRMLQQITTNQKLHLLKILFSHRENGKQLANIQSAVHTVLIYHLIWLEYFNLFKVLCDTFQFHAEDRKT